MSPSPFLSLLRDERGDEFGEKAVVLVMVVAAGIVAWQLFGQVVVNAINSVTAGI